MPADDKWKANMAKVAHMKAFPGLLTQWHELAGKTLATVTPLKGKAGSSLLICTDGSFVVAPPLTVEPHLLGEALHTGRLQLEARHSAAYLQYDRLIEQDKAAQRSARLENILGAIRNNMEQIPELKDRLKELVKEWR
ncbi:MAG: hypothetical protein NBKEAIPA_03589 [Nitrospirae bacterium]|nr:MAG: hypothetical protein UZ03_NOB001001407 [Nitrospira sp. OLB3]MBV6471655.1 hypothetical protein [Nitrospirota bacterium]MCE7966937.1 hypothetical protein [Nitrospira sp. NTP2]QOJ34443.1 MAG: hypothetical protein HRU82_05545 [Nitrospira sp.]RIK57539.1 MAG: hypothetical protein DCC63_13725 [Nitrospira sp.]